MRAHNFSDLSGRRFGRLTVLHRHHAPSARVKWECACDCGGVAVAFACNLVRGHTTSCGCMRRDAIAAAKRTHGATGTHIYAVWQNMLNRCRNQNVRSFSNYGGRGIAVDERWLSFENFLADMGEPPDGMEIDRRNVNEGYFKENCRWVNLVVQANNKRNNRLVTIEGVTQTLAQWVRCTGLSYKTVGTRIYRLRWPIEKALTTPARPKRKVSA